MLRLLHLEDNRQDAELVHATLAADGVRAEIVRVETRDEFAVLLRDEPFDAILADYNLPSFDGVSAQILAAELRPDVPFIFLSGRIGEELAIERVKQGATDYVLKDKMGRLPSALRRALAEAAERAERRRADEEVRRLNAELERRVVERTGALETANSELASRQAELREAQDRFQGVLDHSPAMISVKDIEGRYLLVNRQFERLFDAVAGSIVGKRDHDLFPPRLADLYRANDGEVVAEREAMAFEEPVVHGGAVRVYASSRFPLLDRSGAPYAICGISSDITDRKIAEDELKMARLEAVRANRAKSEFLSRMSHDLRTPLNAILGFAQLLAADAPDADRRENVQQILKGGQLLLDLINEVLDIARIEAGYLSLSPEPVNAREVAQRAMELVAPLAAHRGISLVMRETPESDRPVLADRQRLNQILLNLLSNAVKYNRKDGSVAIAFAERPNRRFHITVTDTGAGIPPEKLALLFTPFERLGAEATAVEGTGLGLALSRRLAEAMGGSLGVHSEVDRGTTFWIDLALSEEAAPIAPDAETPTPVVDQGHAGIILYIEDNVSNVRLMERIFKRRPRVTLLHAGRGQLGIAMAREHHPDAILLDLHLPDLTGEEVLRQLWEEPELRPIPVAVLSADATPGQTRRLKAAGAAAYLTKPLDIAKVLRLVDDLMGVPPAPASTIQE